jgi:hypothetical protein
MVGVQFDMGMHAGPDIRRRMRVRGVDAEQVQQYKTGPAPSHQNMSHSVLKQHSPNANDNTLFNQLSGTLEVYWEMAMSKAKHQFKGRQWNKIKPVLHGNRKDSTSSREAEPHSDQEAEDEGNDVRAQMQPTHIKGAKSIGKLNFIDAKIIFK